MAIEGMQEASYEEQKKKGLLSEDFHLDPNKATDPVEKIMEELGPIGALKKLVDQLEPNPNDQEVIRQIKFVINHLQGTTQH